jgi:hypothetical protein
MNPTTPPVLPPVPESPAELRPVSSTTEAFEAMLRQPQRLLHQLRGPGAARAIQLLAGITLVGALGYGLVIGSFSGAEQWWAAPLKVAAGLTLSALICLPSLYIFAGLSGSTASFREIVGLVASTTALMAVLLAGFAPVAWVFSQSTESVVTMGFLHLAFWAVALGFAFRLLHAGFAGPGRQTAGINVWMVIFLLVMLQMTTALRPLVGRSDTLLPTQKRFFLGHWSECIRDAQR